MLPNTESTTQYNETFQWKYDRFAFETNKTYTLCLRSNGNYPCAWQYSRNNIHYLLCKKHAQYWDDTSSGIYTTNASYPITKHLFYICWLNYKYEIVHCAHHLFHISNADAVEIASMRTVKCLSPCMWFTKSCWPFKILKSLLITRKITWMMKLYGDIANQQ